MTYLDVSADSVIILSLALCLELEWCSIDIQNNGSSVVYSFEKKKKNLGTVQCSGKRTRRRVNPHLELALMKTLPCATGCSEDSDF